MATQSVQLMTILAAYFLIFRFCVANTFSSRLIHRFSDELKSIRGLDLMNTWPERGSVEYYKRLVSSDLARQNMKTVSQSNLLYSSKGSETLEFGNDFGWLHYMWIDVGNPYASFLVALDSGSDLLWVPCDCIHCASLSSNSYTFLDRSLSEYSISGSNSSTKLTCSHQLCELGPYCKNSMLLCPYTINYYSENMSSSGYLVEDKLHLASGDDSSNTSVQVSVLIGCGMNQSGFYLDGVAPDGLMGLGLGNLSVPSCIARSGLVHDSFSLCFNDDDYSGRLFFGDQGVPTQQSTSFLPYNGKYSTYLVRVDACCIGSFCDEHTSFKALLDSGTSFTYFPTLVYEKVVMEFDRQMNATKLSGSGFPWDYCYSSSSQELPKIPSVKFVFALNNSFVVRSPVFTIHKNQDGVQFCLAIQPTDDDVGVIGQNIMTGHRMVFDRENLKLRWSRSDCADLSNSRSMPLTPPNGSIVSNPLPPNEEQNGTNMSAVNPAIAGRTPYKTENVSTRLFLPSFYPLVRSLMLLHLYYTY